MDAVTQEVANVCGIILMIIGTAFCVGIVGFFALAIYDDVFN